MKKINISRGRGAEKTKIAYISISGPVIRKNAINGTNNPPIRIARSQSDAYPVYARDIQIYGPSKLLYSAREPLMRCGARLVLVAAYDDVKVQG